MEIRINSSEAEWLIQELANIIAITEKYPAPDTAPWTQRALRERHEIARDLQNRIAEATGITSLPRHKP